MKTFLSYIRYSNINLSINLNPFVWGFHIIFEKPTSMDPKMYFFAIKILMCRLSIVIDDGSY